MIQKVLFFSVLLTLKLSLASCSIEEMPSWMFDEVQYISHAFQDEISLSKMEKYIRQNAPNSYKIVIRNNQIVNKKIELSSPNNSHKKLRISKIMNAINKILSMEKLPDMTFFFWIGDAFSATDFPYPFFVMSKKKSSSKNLILFPDFHALNGDYQVLRSKDLRNYCFDWKKKINKLIWRGATTQGIYTEETYKQIPRFKLCELSKQYPDLIDAKFTRFGQGGKNIKEINNYSGKHISYEDIFRYKYQMWIDGNAVSYSASGWRFFTNSVIFKPESEYIQWYFSELEPYVHYMPVSRNLEDLVDQILEIQNNDDFAQELANNAREFGKKHITQEECLRYFYHLLMAYSQIKFVE